MSSAASRSSTSLSALPVEILLEIYQHLDLGSILELALTNSSFLSFFEQRKASILLPILIRDFSPLEELLQIHTASYADISAQGGVYRPRRIVFQRYLGDIGQVLAHGCKAKTRQTIGATSGFTRVVKGRKIDIAAAQTSDTIVLTERDLDPILRRCRVVQQWEGLFPQMRWFHTPEDCRSLREHERYRFRRAFYRWWLYGFYFHGDLSRPRAALPEPGVEDVRISQLRYHSTSELLELMDVVLAIHDLILHYICPRLDPNQKNSWNEVPLVESQGRAHDLATGWTDQSRWGRIVKTYAKLGPERLLYYFDNIYSYPRKRLLTETRVEFPNLTFDQSSIHVAIRCALDERQWLSRAPSLAEDSAGGIVDFDDDRDSERETFSLDASSDGRLPPGVLAVRSSSRYSPRGDDGSYLEEHTRQRGFDSQFMSAGALGAVL